MKNKILKFEEFLNESKKHKISRKELEKNQIYTHLEEDLSKESAKDFDKLFKKLVPDHGKCKTFEGEIFRAYNKIAYRRYNDGDLCNTGYGIETAGSAFIFLSKFASQIKGIKELLSKLSSEKNEDKYDKILDKIGELIVSYVKEKVETKKTTLNQLDMLDYYEEAVRRFGKPYEDEDDFEDDDY